MFLRLASGVSSLSKLAAEKSSGKSAAKKNSDFSKQTSKNPYLRNFNDPRFSDYQILLLRTIDESSDLIGPATVLFPGIPIKPYSRSSMAVASLVSLAECSTVFICDGNTAFKEDKPIDWHSYPCIAVPALLSLYIKLQQKGVASSCFYHNEAFIHRLDNMFYCLSDITGFDRILSGIEKEKNSPINLSELLFYDYNIGKLSNLKLIDNCQNSVNSGISVNELINQGKISLDSEMPMPTNLLCRKNFENNHELRKFSDDCYQMAVEEVASYLKSRDQDIAFQDPFDSELLKILISDAKVFLNKTGTEKLINSTSETNFNIPKSSLIRPKIEALTTKNLHQSERK